MKKKIISLFLALTLMLSLAIPAFAAQYVSDGYYGGSYYEIVDNCTYDMYSGTITCMERLVQTTAHVTTSENYASGGELFQGPTQYNYSTVSSYVLGQMMYVYFEHYIDGNVARNNAMYPS